MEDNLPIYKVNHIIGNKINTIFVFNGNYNNNTIFTEKEREQFTRDNTTIVFSEQQIHLDDSIATIKIKILMELKKAIEKTEVSIEEIYLYYQKLETFQSIEVYQALTQNKKLDLTKIRLDQFLSNIVSEKTGKSLILPEEKEVYTYDDILQMNLENKEFIVNKVLGQKFFIVENEYPFVCNPFQVTKFDTFFERTARKSLTTLNNHLILNSGNIINNNIYLCLAGDVLNYLSEKNVSEETTIKIYYPFLYNKNINNIETLNEQRPNLITSNKNFINDKSIQLFKTIDMFYDVYKLKKNDLQYLQSGIKYIKAIIIPDFDIKIPLEIIFKTVHATKENPLIKYNPSSKQENIYRLYTEGIATDGKKIPYLKKATILKLTKNIAKSKSVAVYIETINNDEQTVVCEFNENGYITITADFKNIINENDINVLFRKLLNPIIEEIQQFLEQSGYKLQKFYSLRDSNVEIKQLTYETQVIINKPFNIDLLSGCISSIFINESNVYKNTSDIQLRLKRVSNYSQFSSIEAFILEKAENYKGYEIILAILKNFPDIDQTKAEELVSKVSNEIQIERGVRKSDIKIKENPGFKTIISVNKEKGAITITVDNIDNIYYLLTIPIYLDTMIRITQDKTSTSYPTEEINQLCTMFKGKHNLVINDIISSSEKAQPENEIPVLEEDDEEIDYIKSSEELEEKPKGAFSLFFDDDDDGDDYNEDYNDNDNNDSQDGGGEDDSDSEEDDSEEEYSDTSDENSFNIDLSDDENDEDEDEDDYRNKDSDDETNMSDDDDEKSTINLVKNIDGMKLNKPYYFQTLIEEKDPILILKEDTPKFNSYSRTCSSDAKRQPVILTDKQLNKIKKQHPGFLKDEDVIKYGSNPKKQFNYICPRYWCLKTNSIIDPSELKEVTTNGKTELVHPTCGKIIPSDAKEVPPGHYIYEFKEKKKDYVKQYPGLQLDSHPDGFCLPCCFKKYNTQGRILAREKCIQNKEKTIKKKEDFYIKGPEKFPLEPGRWGYLPVEIQTFLHDTNVKCNITNTKIKTNDTSKNNFTCLLRHGIENSDKQSFIACISDILYYAKKDKSGNKLPILSIKEMRDKIIQSINLDSFIKYQNANLVNDFFNESDATYDINIYKNTKLYSKINFNKPEENFYFNRVINAFENFIKYLKDDEVVIDHTYLWDIISMPNQNLFSNGLNLVILNLPDNDITNNVELLCPTNHYSNEFYEARKPTVIILKIGEYYEPIYSYGLHKKKIHISKEFREYDSTLSKTMKAVFKEIIKPLFKEICKPLDSMPNVYKAKKDILFYNLIEKLDKYDYKVLKLVMNFNSKIIGVIAQEPKSNKSCFVPCYPSSLKDTIKKNIDFTFMTDTSLWNTYNDTVSFLIKLNKRSNKSKNIADIPCKPAFKVIEDELIVGIFTETNQFIQLSEPIHESNINPNLDIPSFKNSNFIVNPKNNPMSLSDVVISTTTTVDNERIDYIKKIKYETNFYNIFRNTIRILLNNYENVKIREKIENELNKEYIIYSIKLKNVISYIKELVSNKIQFIGDANYYKLINDISTCIVKNNKTCKSKENTSNLCAVSVNGCDLILPERNLITGKFNKDIYLSRMADELIRYNRIKSYMFQPRIFLSFSNIGYNLRENEIILLESLINQDYFDNLIPAVINKYTKYNSYDETNPDITQFYDNKFNSLDEAIGKNNFAECNITKKTITSSLWRPAFPDNYRELVYSDNNYCTNNFIIDVIERKTGEKKDINIIKNELYREYTKYLMPYQDKIIDILIIEGKKTLGDQVSNNSLSFSSFIYTDNYFLTTLDLWLLIQKYEIPTIFISQKYILQTNYENNFFIGYGDINDKFIFIVIPGYRPEVVPSFKFIETNTGDIFIPLDKLNQPYQTEIVSQFERKISIEEYLRGFLKPKTSKYQKKIPLMSHYKHRNLIEDTDEDEDDDKVKPKKLPKKPRKLIEEDTDEDEDEDDDKVKVKPKKLPKKPRKLIEEDTDDDDKVKVKPKKLPKKPIKLIEEDTDEDETISNPTPTRKLIDEDTEEEEENNLIKPHNKTKRVRCPKGTHKNRKTGNCEENKITTK